MSFAISSLPYLFLRYSKRFFSLDDVQRDGDNYGSARNKRKHKTKGLENLCDSHTDKAHNQQQPDSSALRLCHALAHVFIGITVLNLLIVIRLVSY